MKKIFLTFLLILLGSSAFAATNNLQMFSTISFVEGSAFKSDNRKQILNNFVEYPLSDKTAIGTIFQASRVTSNYNSGTTAYALNTAEIFHRYKLLSYKKLGVTMHNSYKFPSVYNENQNLGLMPKQADYELRFLFAFNMKDRLINTVVRGDTPYFARFEVSYRRKFSNPFDEARFTLWAGYNFNQKFGILLQDNIVWNLRSKANATDNSYSSFNFSKDANDITNLSLIYRITPDVALQAGYLRRLHGNAPFYDNQGVVVGLWNSF
ncbi:MAG: hypothetical protein KA100_06165 [Rickettsiales bacterium]|nr:hypothetical protein [Rickettsiales bacterium]